MEDSPKGRRRAVSIARSWLRSNAAPLGMMLAVVVLALLAFSWSGFPVSRLSSVVIGDEGDTLTFTGLVDQAIDNLLRRPTNLGYATMFHGQPAPFALTVAPYGVAVMVLPVYLLTLLDLELTMNIYILLTFALSAWATYLLVRHLLSAPKAVAIFAGIGFAFAQFRFLHLVHIETLSTQFLVLTIYCFHRMLDEPRRRWGVATAVAFWFTFFTSGYLGYMFLITAALVIIVALLVVKREVWTPQLVRTASLAAALWLLISSPFLAFRFAKTGALTGYGLDTILHFSAVPADWLAGTSFVYKSVTHFANEKALFIGFVPIVLSVLAWCWRRHLGEDDTGAAERVFSPRAVVILYTVVAFAGLILSLGPRLKVTEGLEIPLPYMLFFQIPGFSSLRVPARFVLLAVIASAVLVSYALTVLARRLPARRFAALFAVLAVVGAVELVPFHSSMARRGRHTYVLLKRAADFPAPPALNDTPPFIPREAYRWLAEQPEGTVVYHHPATAAANRRYVYGARFHRRPMINGRSSFLPAWYSATDWEEFPTRPIVKLLEERGTQYLFVHTYLLSEAEGVWLGQKIGTCLDAGWFSPVASLDGVDIYSLEGVRPPRTVRFEFDTRMIGSGWHGPEVRSETESLTWTAAESFTIEDIGIEASGDLDITFYLRGSVTTALLGTVTLSVGDAAIELEQSRQGRGALYSGVIPRSALPPEGTPLSLHFRSSPPLSPASLRPTSKDTRKLGVAFDWLEIKPHSPAVKVEFDRKLPGGAWHDPEVERETLTFQCMAEPAATLELPPLEVDDLAVVAVVKWAFSPGILASLQMSFNGVDVPLSRQVQGRSGTLSALVPRSVVARRRDGATVAFRVSAVREQVSRVADRPSRMVGVCFDRLLVYPANAIRFEFDDELPGSGWHPSETDFLGTTFRWMARPSATIDLPLPGSEDTVITFRVIRGVTPEILESLKLLVNRRVIALTPVTVRGERALEGRIPASLVHAGDERLTRLTFEVLRTASPRSLGTGPDYRSLGVALDWLELRPASNAPGS